MIKAKYRNRHLLLKVLNDHYNEHNTPNHDLLDASLTYSEIELRVNFSQLELIGQIDYLSDAKEIISTEFEFDTYYSISTKGRASYFDKHHLNSGRRQFWTDTYDVTKTISAVILLIIAIVTFIQNALAIDKNRQEIEKVKSEIQKLTRQK